MKRDVKRLSIPDKLSGQRIDQVLPLLDQSLSRTFVRKLIDFGGVHLNGRRSRTCSLQVHSGDKVELFIDGLPFKPFVLNDNQVVYRDDYILIINKPAGIDCQPTPSRYKGTVYSALLSYLADPFQRHLKPAIGMVQRLDRDTSGLMVFSIHPRAHKNMTEQFASRTIEKIYLAIVAGQLDPEDGEMKSLLARNRATNLMKSVEKGGQEAITRYRTVTSSQVASIVEIELLTGRSHQIRAHFSEVGNPLLGDLRYGGSSTLAGSQISRQMLHASRLSFLHPINGNRVSFSLPLPDDMAYIAQLVSFRPETALFRNLCVNLHI